MLRTATIGEAIGINGGSEEIDLLTRRIDALNNRMLELVNETVAAGKDVESSEEEFKDISDRIEQFPRRITAIQESVRGAVDGGAMKDVEVPACPSMYGHFAHCIETGETPLTSGKEGHETLRLVRSIYRSLETGEVVAPREAR